MVAKKVKRLRKAKKLVSDVVADKASAINPLTPRVETPVVPDSVPRITNETIAEHREDVLGGARKYIYPLAHSKHRIIVITSAILISAIIGLFGYSALALYKLHQHNLFLYRLTQVIPFPIAREGGRFIDYENYLFDLRQYIHYYESQLQRNFAGSDKQQLLQYRKQALESTINAAYVKDLAKRNNVSVSDREVDERIVQARGQNRLGSDDKVFKDVLREKYGWSLSDFKRYFKQQMLSEKVAAALDKRANQKAKNLLSRLKGGANFSALAKRHSDDSRSRPDGGKYGFRILRSDANVPPQVVDALFNLKPGKISGIILASPVLAQNSPTLEIVKVLKNDGTAISAQHITVQLKDISVYIKQLKKQQPPKLYVHF